MIFHNRNKDNVLLPNDKCRYIHTRTPYHVHRFQDHRNYGDRVFLVCFDFDFKEQKKNKTQQTTTSTHHLSLIIPLIRDNGL